MKTILKINIIPVFLCFLGLASTGMDFLGVTGGATSIGAALTGTATATGVPQTVQNLKPEATTVPQVEHLFVVSAGGCGNTVVLPATAPHLPQKRALGLSKLPHWMHWFMLMFI
jgi:hypothetical protein